MSCPHCDPTADGGVIVRKKVVVHETHRADCPALGHRHTTQAEIGCENANQGPCGPLYGEGR
jgi:hypothetical protein